MSDTEQMDNQIEDTSKRKEQFCRSIFLLDALPTNLIRTIVGMKNILWCGIKSLPPNGQSSFRAVRIYDNQIGIILTRFAQLFCMDLQTGKFICSISNQTMLLTTHHKFATFHPTKPIVATPTYYNGIVIYQYDKNQNTFYSKIVHFDLGSITSIQLYDSYICIFTDSLVVFHFNDNDIRKEADLNVYLNVEFYKRFALDATYLEDGTMLGMTPAPFMQVDEEGGLWVLNNSGTLSYCENWIIQESQETDMQQFDWKLDSGCEIQKINVRHNCAVIQHTEGNKFAVLDLETRQLLWNHWMFTMPIQSWCITATKRILACSFEKTIRQWTLHDGEEIVGYPANKYWDTKDDGKPQAINCSDCGAVLVGFDTKKIRVFSL